MFGDDSTDKEAVRQKLGINTEEAGKGSVPVGTVAYFAMATPPVGYLKADGSAVSRETYPELFSAIGTTYGSGDGIATFNLPDLMGRFAEGSNLPGTVKEAGLPNIEGRLNFDVTMATGYGALLTRHASTNNGIVNTDRNDYYEIGLDASLSNPIYGKSNTVQPPALTLLPCIKAFHA